MLRQEWPFTRDACFYFCHLVWSEHHNLEELLWSIQTWDSTVLLGSCGLVTKDWCLTVYCSDQTVLLWMKNSKFPPHTKLYICWWNSLIHFLMVIQFLWDVLPHWLIPVANNVLKLMICMSCKLNSLSRLTCWLSGDIRYTFHTVQNSYQSVFAHNMFSSTHPFSLHLIGFFFFFFLRMHTAVLLIMILEHPCSECMMAMEVWHYK